MKLALISDTHGDLPQIDLFKGADAVLHAGDIGPDYNVQDWCYSRFHLWHHRLTQDLNIPFYGTYGNHDFPDRWPPYPYIKINELVQIGSKKIWFSPWSPLFGSWAWMLAEPDLMREYEKIPPDTNIIVSHSPPYQICDRTLRGEPVGSKALRVRMMELPQLEYVICGHIHEARGRAKLDQIQVLNVASKDEYYNLRQEPITWLDI